MFNFKLKKKIIYIKIVLCIFSIVYCLNISYAQRKVTDSLKREITNLKSKIKFTEKDTTYLNLINELASELLYYNSDSVFILSNKALKISSSIKYTKGNSVALTNLSQYYLNKGEYKQSIIHLKKALVFTEQINNPNITVIIYNLLGLSYAELDDYANALSSYLQGIKLAKKMNDYKWLAFYNGNIAGLYTYQEDYEQALYFYNKITQIKNKIKSTKIEANIFSAEVMSNIANIYANTGEYEKAFINVNKSIETFKENNIYDWLAYAYRVKGYIYLKQKKYKWAINWFEESLFIHKKIDDDIEKIKLQNNFAQAYLGLDKNNLSVKHAANAYEAAKKINDIKQLQKAAKTLYEISKKENNINEALRYNEVYQEITDLRAQKIKSRSLTMFKAKTEYEEQEQKLILENKKKLKAKQNNIYTFLIITLISVFVIIIILKSKKTQKKLNIKLKKQKTALLKREIELRDNDETKSMLFSIIGHDLRGPICQLEALLDLFKKGDIKNFDFLNMIPKLQKDVNHISFTLNNLLSWSQTQMKSANTNPTDFIFNNLVEENINLLIEISKKKSIIIKNNLHNAINIWADRNQIDIVVRNLLSNALKFTHISGNIILNSIEKENSWVISIKDTGIGMDKLIQEKIFKKNTNITTFGTNNEKGTGIGLSLCKEMIEKNKGSIWVESTLNKGSVFFFTLPKNNIYKDSLIEKTLILKSHK